MTLTHDISHGWADSSADKPRWNGLNQLGREVVSEIDRLGMVIDISHVSDKAFFDEDTDLRITIEHLSQGRDWPLEGRPTVEDILDHIDHAVKTAGIDHVGLGADMYPRTPSPEGVRGAHDYGNITRGLKRRGYSDDGVKKIMGGNFLRVWKRVTDKAGAKG